MNKDEMRRAVHAFFVQSRKNVEKGWIKGHFYSQEWDGDPSHHVSVCALGAVLLAEKQGRQHAVDFDIPMTPEMTERQAMQDVRVAAECLMHANIMKPEFGNWQSIPHWNDAGKTTKEDVLDFFDKIIEMTKEPPDGVAL